MASSASAPLLLSSSVVFCRRGVGPTTIHCCSEGPSLQVSRRVVLLSAAGPVVLTTGAAPAAVAKDIPLFGLRRKLEKIEEEAAEVAREGEKAVEGGIEVAEEEVKAVEKGLLLGGGPVQAAAVAAAEAVGVLVGVSVVNGILGADVQRGNS